MKLLCILGCLLLCVSAFAQDESTVQMDTSKRFVIRDPAPIRGHEKYLCIIDNKEYYKTSVSDVFPIADTSNILEVSVAKGDSAIAIYGEAAENGVVIITTKAYAGEQIELLLSRLVKGYKEYRQTHKDDKDFFYVVASFSVGEIPGWLLCNFLIPVDLNKLHSA